MIFNKLTRTPVGADLSRPSPMYRPSVPFPTIQIISLIAVFSPYRIMYIVLHTSYPKTPSSCFNSRLEGTRFSIAFRTVHATGFSH